MKKSELGMRQKLQLEERAITTRHTEPVTTYIHCGLPFGYGEDYISEEVSLCDAYDAD